ncbi:uncharacterized protein LOC108628341 isoform X2 [Ceratina calcarata]|uniref:Uncharacterized protein LOC108628341 isoform X2 n=1 Tax=Ceratina calcarata TaxID=156304 RepID=A0AAJ7NAE4_9HYME|nr:uncharacterized protein LOC108628341 isoform X2 [Ceratina calcarata]
MYPNVFKDASVLIFFYLTPSLSQMFTEVDVPELHLLASNLKPEECAKLVLLNSDREPSEDEVNSLAREQTCFRRLVKWVCQLRTVTRNTYPILNDLLERIGRPDLIECLQDLRDGRKPLVVRQADESEDYEAEPTTAATASAKSKEENNQFPSDAIKKIGGGTTLKVTLKTAGIVLASTVLLTCCCTLIIRNRLTKVLSKIRGKKKKNKLIDETEDVARSYLIRRPRRIKRKRAPSYEMVHTATQNTLTLGAAEPVVEEPQPTPACFKCYKKKRKKTAKKPPHR